MSEEIGNRDAPSATTATADRRERPDGTTAQRRWRLLARALARSPEPRPDAEDEVISVRRFTSFGLVSPAVLENAPADPEASWCEYSTVVDGASHQVQIRRIDKICFTANELMGFNNTGNVCVWPSEECLAYYLLKNRRTCATKRVLELGGGMSCLAGVFVAKYCNPRCVTLTDGNVTSVENARRIVARNDMVDSVKCGVVQWGRAARALRQAAEINGNRAQPRDAEEDDEQTRRTEGLYDVILSADCLFFDDARLDLVETIYGWLAEDGVALVMAPRRGTTFQKFAEAAVERGFVARQRERYDGAVWSRHLELSARNREYCADLHYPLLLELTKRAKPG